MAAMHGDEIELSSIIPHPTDEDNDVDSQSSKSVKAESQSLLGDDGRSERSVKNVTSGSFASFGDDVYAPTTVNTAPAANDSTCKEECGTLFKSCCTKSYIKFKPLMWKYYPRPTPESPWKERLRYSLMCPPHGTLALVLILTLATILGFCLVWSITEEQGLPGGNFFGLFILFILCSLSGWAISLIHLPPLLGMLIMGLLLGNVPHVDVGTHITPEWSAGLRKVALAIILCRAGLGLDSKALKRMSMVVLRLAFLPCMVEAVICMIFSHFIMKLPWLWGLMLGFVLAAVSPAVVVPSLLVLSEQGYGVAKGIPTLIIAAASLDDVLAISSFSICLGIVFSESDNYVLTAFKGPLEALTGVVYGIILGLVLWYLPNMTSLNRELKRTGFLLAGGLFALFGSDVAEIAGAGALGCLTLPFVAALRWRRELPKGVTEMPMEKYFGYLWTIFQPLLFGLIGAAVDLRGLKSYDIIGLGIAVILIGLVFRLIASFLAIFGAGLTLREKIFVPLAWLPKATVQALIGSIAYDKARERGNNPDHIKWGQQILTVAVLVILLTAPLGAVAIAASGPRLLTKTDRSRSQRNSQIISQNTELIEEKEKLRSENRSENVASGSNTGRDTTAE